MNFQLDMFNIVFITCRFNKPSILEQRAFIFDLSGCNP